MCVCLLWTAETNIDTKRATTEDVPPSSPMSGKLKLRPARGKSRGGYEDEGVTLIILGLSDVRGTPLRESYSLEVAFDYPPHPAMATQFPRRPQAMKDPYEAVLSDLRDKRRQIDEAIAALESVQRGQATSSRNSRLRGETDESRPKDPVRRGAKVSIAEAAVEILKLNGRPMSNEELVVEVQRAGIVMRSKDDRNTMGALIRRRAEQVGDVQKVSRGVWALAAWSYLDGGDGSDASTTPAVDHAQVGPGVQDVDRPVQTHTQTQDVRA
jgi:hypothetical protein